MDVMQRRRELMGMQGVLKTVSGPIVTVNDALARNAKSLVVNFAPIQAAGTPSPDNVLPISGWTGVTATRCGANLLDYSTDIAGYRLNSTGKLSENYNYRTSDWIPVEAGVNYYFRAVLPSGLGYSVCRYTAKGENTFLGYKNIGTGTSVVSGYYTIPDDGTRFIRISYARTYAGDPAVLVGATDFAPYSGTTYPVTFPAVGANLLDESEYVSGHAYFVMSKYSALVGQTIKLTFTNGAGVTVTPKIATSGGAAALWQGAALASGNTNTYSVTLTSAMAEVNLYLISLSTYGQITQSQFEDCKLMLSTSSTSYEPYTNTIYGGYVDLVSGVLTATWAGIDMGEMPWEYYTGSTPKFFFAVIDDVLTDSANNSLCSVYKYASSMSVNNNSFQFSGKQLRIRSDSYSDKSDFKSTLSGQIFVYPLATPITYQLTPQTVAMLRGTNNVWSNANGNVELTYYAQ